MKDYSLSEYDTSVLISDKNLSSYFESVIQSKKLEPKNVANWILTDLLGLANKNRSAVNELPITPDRLEQCFDTQIHQSNLNVIWERLGM